MPFFRPLFRRPRRLLAAAVLGVALLNGAHADTAPLKVGISTSPQIEALKVAAKEAKAQADVKIVEFTDWNTPNAALANKDIDVNYFQHIPFLENANKQGGYNFVSIAPGTIMKIGLYSKKVKSFSELKDGAKVAIANDPVNGGRGLLLLQRAGHHAEAGRGPRDDARHRREPEAPEDHPARSVAARALPRRRRSRAGLPELHQARRHDRPEQRAAVRRHREQDLRDPVGRAAGQRERSAHPQVHLDLPALAGGAQGARQRVRLAVRDRVVTEAA